MTDTRRLALSSPESNHRTSTRSATRRTFTPPFTFTPCGMVLRVLGRFWQGDIIMTRALTTNTTIWHDEYYIGNGTSEALTGAHAGRVLSRVSLYIIDRSADAVENAGRQHCSCRYREACSDSARSKTPSTYGNSLHRNWDILCSGLYAVVSKLRTVNPKGVIQ